MYNEHTTKKMGLFIISALALLQIIGCLAYSFLVDKPLAFVSEHFWFGTFNHFISFITLAIIFFLWVCPLQKKCGNITDKLAKSEKKSSDVRLILRGQIDLQFGIWGLSLAEHDVGLLSLKGLRISEIAEIRQTRVGTIKAHLNSIFRKANVGSRPEFLATCLENLIDWDAERRAKDTCDSTMI